MVWRCGGVWCGGVEGCGEGCVVEGYGTGNTKQDNPGLVPPQKNKNLIVVGKWEVEKASLSRRPKSHHLMNCERAVRRCRAALSQFGGGGGGTGPPTKKQKPNRSVAGWVGRYGNRVFRGWGYFFRIASRRRVRSSGHRGRIHRWASGVRFGSGIRMIPLAGGRHGSW